MSARVVLERGEAACGVTKTTLAVLSQHVAVPRRIETVIFAATKRFYYSLHSAAGPTSRAINVTNELCDMVFVSLALDTLTTSRLLSIVMQWLHLRRDCD